MSLHYSLLFPFILGFLGAYGKVAGDSSAANIMARLGSGFQGMAQIATIFGFVLLHEFGHILQARKFGIDCQYVMLSIIGGVAALEKMPDNEREELLVTMAGPLVNGIAMILTGPWMLLHQNSMNDPALFASAVRCVFISNTFLFLFNIIPAFPMDGGRILRALLSMHMGRLKATKLASNICYMICGMLAVLSIASGSYTTLLTLGFVIFLAYSERSGVVKQHEQDQRFDLVREEARQFFFGLEVAQARGAGRWYVADRLDKLSPDTKEIVERVLDSSNDAEAATSDSEELDVDQGCGRTASGAGADSGSR